MKGQRRGSIKSRQLLSQRFPKTTSAGYQTARANFTGTDPQKEAKATALFASIFGSVIIGKSATQYNNIRYVLGKLDVSAKFSSPHEHHFHVTMAPPAAIGLTKNLLAERTPEETTMFELAYNATDALQLAQAYKPPALVASKPSWISNEPPSDLKALIESIKNSEAFRSVNPYTYAEKGPLGMPSLAWETPVDYIRTRDWEVVGGPVKTRTMPHAMSLAFASCYRLDIEAKQAGAWGPECKIAKFIKRPKGKLSPPTWPGASAGDYMYTPPGVGTDTVRFILENGAGKQVDVTVKIKVGKWESEGKVESDPTVAGLDDSNVFSACLQTVAESN